MNKPNTVAISIKIIGYPISFPMNLLNTIAMILKDLIFYLEKSVNMKRITPQESS